MLSPSQLQPASGLFDADGVHHFPVRVYFEDTDLSGVVYHANYLRFMERARSDMLRVIGIDQRANQENGVGVYMVADLNIAYKRPARLDDDLIVSSAAIAVGAAICTIRQTIRRGDQILTEATVTAAFLSPEGRPKRQPREWVTTFQSLLQGDASKS